MQEVILDIQQVVLHGQDYLTDEEKKEVVELGQQVFSRDAAKSKDSLREV